jgi:hypothetical protein
MSQPFTQLVERVKQLSLDEKQELLELLDGLLEGTGQKANGHVVTSKLEKETCRCRLSLSQQPTKLGQVYLSSDLRASNRARSSADVF